ncbi:organic cation transporter protein isoform X2 [Manduca sexta]|uniref:organic cation transporter protein isoform X2 n=1 Tax=Manduca sexta TaxID=7130 RepID=UPI00188E750A|nr:organic cation transporter protein isoform X2 [Manduca sexta]
MRMHLTVQRTSLASLAQSMMQIGILGGSLIFGHISDRYGRKLSSLLSLLLQVLFVAISAVITEFWMFLVCRFLIGVTVGGVMLCCYVLIIEYSGKSFRPYLVGLSEVSFITGYMVLPLIAYYVRDWRNLQLWTSLPWIFLISYYWLLPESPRWLISVGRKKEAVELLAYIAKKNNRSVDNIEEIVEKIENEKPASYPELFKTPKIRMYAFITALVWMLCAHTFFGINQYIGRLQGNLYLNVFLSATFLIPGIFLVVLATLYLKRKISVTMSFCTAAISLIIIIFIPSEMTTAILIFAIIGQMGGYTTFVQVYLYSSEVFPTVIRNSAMGFASVFGRFGGFIAPFVVNIGIEWVSLTIFSGLAFCAVILVQFLPETKGTVLINTIEETERRGNKTEPQLSAQ